MWKDIRKFVCTFPILHVQTRFFMYLNYVSFVPCPVFILVSCWIWMSTVHIWVGMISLFDSWFALWYLEIFSADHVQSYILNCFGGFLAWFSLRYADKYVLQCSCLVYVKFKDIVNILLILLGTKWHCTFVRLFKCF